MEKFAIARLLKEWREYQITPSPIKKMINIIPLEDNIFEWHGNIAPPNEHPYYSGYIFHFVIYFPTDYPKNPPGIDLKTGFAHSNIIPNRYDNNTHRMYSNYLCMDIINNFFWQSDKGQSEYKGWSSAYSIEAILLQLYTFLFEERVENYDGNIKLTLYDKPPELGGGNYNYTGIYKNLEIAWQKSINYKCEKCQHTYDKPFPIVNKSIRKSVENINIRKPVAYTRLNINSLTPNIIKLPSIDTKKNTQIQETSIHSSNSSVNSDSITYSDTVYDYILSKIKTQKKHIITPYIDKIVNNNFDIKKISPDLGIVLIICKNAFSNVDNIEYQVLNNQHTILYNNSDKTLFGHNYITNHTFFDDSNLINKITQFLFSNARCIINDFSHLYRFIPNKMKYFKNLFKIDTNDNNNVNNDVYYNGYYDNYNLQYDIYDDIYKAPEITPETTSRCIILLNKLAELMTNAIINPNRYILKKWSKTVDELFSILDINSDINVEISTAYNITVQQKSPSNLKCSLECKICYPNGAPTIIDDFIYPFKNQDNQIKLANSFIEPELFHLKYIIRPESIDNIVKLYKLWLVKYSDMILDKLSEWGYDYSGNLINKINKNEDLDELYLKNSELLNSTHKKNISIDLPFTIQMDIMDNLPNDSRLLLAGISPQFAKLYNTPEYKEKTWLKCWVSGATFKEDILGYPIVITTYKSNTNTSEKSIKDISTTMDILSLTSYKELKIDKTVWNKPFSLFLPLYITPVHFNKSKDYIMNAILSIYFNRKLDDKQVKLDAPTAVVINDIFSTLLNSLIIEMMKGETHISLKALEGFTQLYRTWVALTKAYPELICSADKVLRDFITKQQNRHKRITPNLGKLLMLICISSEYTWENIRDIYLEESRSRNILWILKDCPELLDAKHWGDILPYLDKILKATIIGKRLQIFNKYFTELVKIPGFIDKLDETYGYPSEEFKLQFQVIIKDIYKINDWVSYYKLTGLNELKNKELAYQIYWDIRTSSRKGYNQGIKGINKITVSDYDLLRIFENKVPIEEINEFFNSFRSSKI